MNITGNNIPSPNKILLTTDLDGTLFHPTNDHKNINVEDRKYCLKSIKNTENAILRNNIESVMLNTGRNYTELCEIQDILQQTTIPITGISLEEGKRLLVKPKKLSPTQWLSLLFNKKINYTTFQDKTWTDTNNAPLQAIGEFLTKEKGFIHRKDDGEKLIYSKPIEQNDEGVTSTSKDALWIVTLVPPGINFETKVRNTSKDTIVDIGKFNKALTEDIYQMLAEEGFDVSHPKTQKEILYKNKIERNDINKGTVTDYFKTKTQKHTEIRAGNAQNDISLLSPINTNIQMIQVGDDKELTDSLSSHPNLTKVPNGKLDLAIDIACKKLNYTA